MYKTARSTRVALLFSQASPNLRLVHKILTLIFVATKTPVVTVSNIILLEPPTMLMVVHSIRAYWDRCRLIHSITPCVASDSQKGFEEQDDTASKEDGNNF